jgi:hypothetical protein
MLRAYFNLLTHILKARSLMSNILPWSINVKQFKATISYPNSNRGTYMGKLYLRCKTCSLEFQAGVVFDKNSFEPNGLERNSHTCPHGHKHQYSNKDYYFK